MTTYTTLIILSSLVIFSYIFDVVATKTKLPSVLLLLFLGIGLRLLVDHLKLQTFNFLNILPALGTVGLILIVFEGSLDLKYNRHKNKIIKGAFFAAFFMLVGTIAAIAFIIYQITGKPLNLCIINAIPFSVISSAIAIPSVASLNKHTKEYIVYESSFSDILTIIIFNFAVSNPYISVGSFASLGLNTALIVIISVAACIFLLYLMGKIAHHIKFFLIISILILVYAIGQSYHLAALVLILAFGLFLNNADAINHTWFKTVFLYKNFSKDLAQLHQLSAETAFIIRTFFFVIFGFTINIFELNNQQIVGNGLLILGSIYLIRFAYLLLFNREHVLPEGFVSPRGLISILLYYNLPENMKIAEISTSFLFMVVLGSSIVMSLGLVLSRKKIRVN